MSEQLPQYTVKVMLPGNQSPPGTIPMHYGYSRVALVDTEGNVVGLLRGVTSVAIESLDEEGGAVEMAIGIHAEVAVEAPYDGH